MRLPLLPILLLLIFNIALDAYLYIAARRRCNSKWPAVVEAVSAVLAIALLIVTISLPKRSGGEDVLSAVTWMLFIYLSIYAAKIIIVLFDLLASVPRLWHRRRIRWVTNTGCVLGACVFALMWWSALVTRYDLKVNEIDVPIKNLPQAFDGYKILQVSDMHVGTYGTDTTFMAEIVDAANALHPDMIVFTGDIVNRRSAELEPFATVLARLKAPDGVVSILGNHDYGDYATWSDAAAKEANRRQLVAMQRKMGWKLLLDSTLQVRRGADSLAVIGVENIGEHPFPSYGHLEEAYPGSLGDGATKVLLTHNPRHWTDSIADNPAKNIALTLSGHTHAMQIAFGNWSPSKYRYKTWGGLYPDNHGHYLYVNIGTGTVGTPMRVGSARPELTLITLKK